MAAVNVLYAKTRLK